MPLRFSSLLSLGIILLCQKHELEVISLPIVSFSRSETDRSAKFAGSFSLSARKSASTIRSRFQLLTRGLAREDSNGSAISVVRRNLFKVLGCNVLLGPPVLEVYARTGTTDADFEEDIIPPPTSSGGCWDSVEHLTLVFHGSGGQDAFTDKLMQNINRSDDRSHYSSIVEWSKYSTNFLQASFNGQRLGRCTAKKILDNAPNMKSVHVIGISVGAFAADSFSDDIKARRKESVYVQLTLLDPFTQRGIFDVGYGSRKYGERADYFQQYLDTDDPVPSTNTPLEKSVCYDITAIRPKEISFGHDWPVVYYSQKKNIGLVPLNDRLPRGTVIKVED